MKTIIVLAAILISSTIRASVEVVAGAPKTAELSEPFSVDFDPKGVMYGVEFTKSNRVFKLENGTLSFIAGMQHVADEKPAPEDVHDGPDLMRAIFKGMHDIQVAGDDLIYVGDSFHNRVRLLDLKNGRVSTIAGTGRPGFSGDGGPAKDATFSIAMTSSLSPDRKRIYVADIGNSRTRMIDLASGIVRTVAGNGKKGLPVDGTDALNTPMGDTRAVTQAKDGTLYVLLRGGNSLVSVKDGKARTVVNARGKKGYAGDGGDAHTALMNGPKYLAMDPSGKVIICDTENHCLRRYSPATGRIELIAGKPPRAGNSIGTTLLETELNRPHGVRIAPDGSIFICDTNNNRVLRADYH